MSNIASGITYYSLESEYQGDVTKNCGLTAAELDNNFYFLRGNDVSAVTWDDDNNKFVITKENGSTIESNAVGEYVDKTIEHAVSALTDELQDVECRISGMQESIDGAYEQLDMEVSGLTNLINTTAESVLNESKQDNQNLKNELDARIDILDRGMETAMSALQITGDDA